MRTPLAVYLLSALHFLLAAGALYGGWMLLTDPDGFGMQDAWLSRSPFHSYRFPGLFLFIVFGLLPLLVARGLLHRQAFPLGYVFNIYRDRHWAWTYSLYVGLMLIGWITVQIALVPYFWLQPIVLGLALLILAVSLLPAVMRYFQKGK